MFSMDFFVTRGCGNLLDRFCGKYIWKGCDVFHLKLFTENKIHEKVF